MKPRFRKVKGGWSCAWGGFYVRGKTVSLTFGKLFDRAIADCDETIEHIRAAEVRNSNLLQLKIKELEKLLEEERKKTPEWIVERINHYNQACIDYIWQTKTLPSIDLYIKLTGRGL